MVRLLLSCILIGSFAAALAADDTDKAILETLRAIQQELRELRKGLQPPQPAAVKIEPPVVMLDQLIPARASKQATREPLVEPRPTQPERLKSKAETARLAALHAAIAALEQAQNIAPDPKIERTLDDLRAQVKRSTQHEPTQATPHTMQRIVIEIDRGDGVHERKVIELPAGQQLGTWEFEMDDDDSKEQDDDEMEDEESLRHLPAELRKQLGIRGISPAALKKLLERALERD